MRLALAAAVLVACHHDAPPPAAPPPAPTRTAYQELEARMPAILAALGKLGDELHAEGDDCAKLASSLRRFGADHAAELPELQQLIARLTPDERERFDYEHADDRDKLSGVFRTAINPACASDPKMHEALEAAGFHRQDAR